MDDRNGAPPEGGAPDRFDGADPLAPFRPAEPTFRAEPAVRATDGGVDRAATAAATPVEQRELELPVDTGQLRALSTGQLLVVHRPPLPGAAAPVEYDVPDEDEQRRLSSWISVVLGSVGAVASLFVGWMLPLSLAAIVFGVLGLRREEHGRALAFAGIGTGVAGLVFSAVWIGYYAIVFGALPS
jgi:O-acetyl-ADP-ribose deacetylase (regulator of RNase III)